MQQNTNKSTIIILVFATLILQLGGHKLNSLAAGSGTDRKRLFTPGAVMQWNSLLQDTGDTENISGRNWTDSQKLAQGDYIQKSHVWSWESLDCKEIQALRVCGGASLWACLVLTFFLGHLLQTPWEGNTGLELLLVWDSLAITLSHLSNPPCYDSHTKTYFRLLSVIFHHGFLIISRPLLPSTQQTEGQGEKLVSGGCLGEICTILLHVRKSIEPALSPIHQDGTILGDLTAARRATKGPLHFRTGSLRVQRLNHHQHPSVRQQW